MIGQFFDYCVGWFRCAVLGHSESGVVIREVDLSHFVQKEVPVSTALPEHYMFRGLSDTDFASDPEEFVNFLVGVTSEYHSALDRAVSSARGDDGSWNVDFKERLKANGLRLSSYIPKGTEGLYPDDSPYFAPVSYGDIDVWDKMYVVWDDGNPTNHVPEELSELLQAATRK